MKKKKFKFPDSIVKIVKWSFKNGKIQLNRIEYRDTDLKDK